MAAGLHRPLPRLPIPVQRRPARTARGLLLLKANSKSEIAPNDIPDQFRDPINPAFSVRYSLSFRRAMVVLSPCHPLYYALAPRRAGADARCGYMRYVLCFILDRFGEFGTVVDEW